MPRESTSEKAVQISVSHRRSRGFDEVDEEAELDCVCVCGEGGRESRIVRER